MRIGLVLAVAVAVLQVLPPTAAQGIPGPPGPQGPQGPAGPQGPPGPGGPAGGRGPAGPAGDIGPSGPAGRDGAPGERGPQGSPGNDGRDGVPGAPGQPGIGERGERGEAGRQGSTGRQGPQGAPGNDGHPGPAGPRGLPGNDGQDGLQGPRGPRGPRGESSTIYTRWGSRVCPDTEDTELLYNGRVGGSHFLSSGGGSNYLCMPQDPEYTLLYNPGVQGYSRLHGAEYENPIGGRDDTNIPCAVCLTTSRGATLMIPGRTSCRRGWTMEYEGYIMSERQSNNRGSFVCVDRSVDPVPRTAGNRNGALFYHVEVDCRGFQCPPYDEEKELTCVVCTR